MKPIRVEKSDFKWIAITWVLYFLAARLGLLLDFEHTNASPVWPPSGIALSLLLLLGPRILPGIFLGAVFANFVSFMGNTNISLWNMSGMSVVIGIGNTLEGYVAYRLISQRMVVNLFDKAREVFLFLVIALVACTISSTIGNLSLYAGGIISAGQIPSTFYIWLLGDVTGVVLLTPLILAWSRKRSFSGIPKRKYMGFELALNLLLIIGFSYFIFINSISFENFRIRNYVVFPLLMWTLYRFSHRETITAMTIVTIFAIVGTLLTQDQPDDLRTFNTLLQLQAFIYVISISLLAMQASLNEQRQAVSLLNREHEMLEKYIEERTEELAISNRLLHTEIEQHKMDEERLRKVEQEFLKACQLAKLGHWQWDVHSNKINWSDELYELYGLDKNTFDPTFENYLELLYPADKAYAQEVISKAIEEHSSFTFFHRYYRSNGKVCWMLSNGEVLLNDEGQVDMLIGTGQEVTDIREKEIITSHLASIVEYSTDGISSIDMNGTINSWNKGSEVIFGYAANEIVGKNISILIPKDKPEERINLLDMLRHGRSIENQETQRIRKDGQIVNISLTLSPIFDVNGNVIGASKIDRDITKMKAREDEKFKRIVESTPNTIILVSGEGLIELVNSQTEKMFGYSRTELMGQPIEILLPMRFRKNHPEHRGAFFHKPEARGMGAGRDLFALHKDGREIPVEIGLNPIEMPEGMMVLAVIVDISERKKIEKATREQELDRQSLKMKDQFMANMSHEIRTPINAIIGFSNLLEKSELDRQQVEYVSAVKNSSRHLLTIINDILDYSKIQAGKLSMEQVPLEIVQTVYSIYQLFELKAKEKGLNLIFDLYGLKELWVLGDRVRFSQILMNLLSNAIKFTEKGEVKLSMKLLKKDDKNCKLHFTLSDTGIGIPPDKIGQVFKRFTQASADTTRKYGGTGLGLSIVKSLIDLHQGTLHVESVSAKGSSFSFDLEYKLSSSHNNESTVKVNRNEIEISNAGPIHLLLAEDNKMNQRLATIILQRNGIKVETAENGKEALAKALENEYDVILMDIQMPEMDGYEAAVEIRRQVKRYVPIIAMTAHAMSGEKEKCLGYGMDDYISKPFIEEDLIEKIRKAKKVVN